MTKGSILGHLAVTHSHTPVSYREQTLTYSTWLGWERGQQLPRAQSHAFPGKHSRQRISITSAAKSGLDMPGTLLDLFWQESLATER